MAGRARRWKYVAIVIGGHGLPYSGADPITDFAIPRRSYIFNIKVQTAVEALALARY